VNDDQSTEVGGVILSIFALAFHVWISNDADSFFSFAGLLTFGEHSRGAILAHRSAIHPILFVMATAPMPWPFSLIAPADCCVPLHT